MSDQFPPVAVTCGDPSGIGPEIAAKAWDRIGAEVPFFLIGDPEHLPGGTDFTPISSPSDAVGAASLPVLVHRFAQAATPGRPHPANAPQVVEVIEKAVALVREGMASSVTTCPISKKELADHAGFIHPGHTEFLAALGGVERSVMMLAAEELRVIPATIHIPLAEVPGTLTEACLEETIRVAEAAMRDDFGIDSPRVAVAGLNPHAGEDGLLGREEIEMIRPLCDRLRSEGMAVIGPLPADTMFHAAARKTYDVAVAMYHDQALVPIKTLAFDRGVNVTLGLPFVRTSPDHGTAYGIAGQGIADATSLVEAIRLADKMARGRAGA